MNTETGSLETLIQEKIDTDTDFQDSLTDLSEDEQAEAIEEKRKELVTSEYASLKESSEKHKELADNYKVRAEKAEDKAKKGDTTPNKDDETSKKDEDSLSTTDIYALVKAEVPEEDVEEVLKASKLLGKSIAESLKDDVVISILATKQEQRDTVKATSTDNKRSTTKKISGAEVLKKMSTGEMPEKGSPEAEALFWERRGGKR